MNQFKTKVSKGIKPEIIWQSLLDIQEKYGQLTSELVLKEARNRKHVLHGCFTWDNKEAAEKCRLMEAAELIRSLMKAEEVNGKQVYIRAFTNILKDENGNLTTNFFNAEESVFISTESVLSNYEYRVYALKRCTMELQSVRRKFGHLSEFAQTWAALDIELEQPTKKEVLSHE